MLHKDSNFSVSPDNAIPTKTYAMIQEGENIVIQRRNLQHGYFTTYTERHKQIHSRTVGSFAFQEISFDNLQFINCDYQLANKEHICIDIENEVLEMHFRLQGSGTVIRENNSLDLKAGNHMLSFQDNHQQEVWMNPAQNGSFYEIRIGLSHLDKLMGNYSQSSATVFAGIPLTVTPEMYSVISQLRATTYSGNMKALFLEAKMTELFLLQLQQINNRPLLNTLSIKPYDKDKIYDAKYLIEQHLDEFITISQLSQQVGINQRKLMQGFKALFGCTVYQYIIELKMQTAKDLLLNKNRNVNEVADHIGYQNPQHFISAFKKKFGTSPGKLKA